VPTVDEILTALAGIGFLVWRLDQGNDESWSTVLEDTQADPLAHYRGNGATALEALLVALGRAGIKVEA
jgi:hypothetical protein